MAELTARESERQRVQKVGQVYRDKGYDVRKEVALFFQNGHLEAAFLMGWSLVEATLRVLAVKEGIEGETATPDYLLKQMTFEGIIARETYYNLKHAQQTRDAIAPGFKSSQLTVETVQELI